MFFLTAKASSVSVKKQLSGVLSDGRSGWIADSRGE